MDIDGTVPLPDGAAASVRRRSAVGEPYVAIEAPSGWHDGDRAMATDGYRIPIAATSAPLAYGELFAAADSLLAAVDPDALGTVTRELAVALGGRGDTLARLVDSGSDAVSTLATGEAELRALGEGLTALAHTLAERSGTIADATADLGDIVETVATNTDDIEALLEESPVLADRINVILASSYAQIGLRGRRRRQPSAPPSARSRRWPTSCGCCRPPRRRRWSSRRRSTRDPTAGTSPAPSASLRGSSTSTTPSRRSKPRRPCPPAPEQAPAPTPPRPPAPSTTDRPRQRRTPSLPPSPPTVAMPPVRPVARHHPMATTHRSSSPSPPGSSPSPSAWRRWQRFEAGSPPLGTDAGGVDPMSDEDLPSEDQRDDAEAAADAPPLSTERRRRNRAVPPSGVVALLLAVGAWVLSRPDPADGSLDDAHQRRRAFGAAYLTFDASSVDLAGDELLALTTDEFAAEFRSDRLPAVSDLFADSSTSTRAQVSETFLTPEADGRVQALVLVDVDASAAEGSQRLINLSFVIELVRADGEWKVDGVSPLPAPEVLSPTTPTTTSTSRSSGADPDGRRLSRAADPRRRGRQD